MASPFVASRIDYLFICLFGVRGFRVGGALVFEKEHDIFFKKV
jgi:hypothetical protein